MKLFHNIAPIKVNSNYNLSSEVKGQTGPISFDGVYYNIWLYQSLLEGKDVTLFVTGDYVGGDNTFDEGQPFERFCDWNQIMDLVTIYGCKLGWHSWSHRDLTTLSDRELKKEVTPPFPMDAFAYPHGRFDDRVIEAVKKAGYKEAFSVTAGDNSEYQRLREYV